MATKKQIKANRRNARRSTGPRTRAGTMSKGIRNTLINWSLLCSAIFIVLGLAETTFRYFYDPQLKLSAKKIWEAHNVGRPTDESMFTTFGGIRFREERIPDDILEKKWRRILFLGDSFTYGSGINNNESRFSNVIEKELNQELLEDQEQYRIHIFNASEGGSSPSNWFTTFETIAPIYQPQHVFAIFFLRDGAPLGTSLKFNTHIIEPIQQRYAQMPLYSRSAFLRYFYDRFAWMEYTNRFKQILISSYLGSYEERSKWLFQQRFLVMISNKCRDRGMSFHLVIFPMLFDLKDYQFHDVENEIAKFARDNEISVYSLTSGFIGEEDSELWVASNNQHPNEKAHRIAATTLLPFIAEVYKNQTDSLKHDN